MSSWNTVTNATLGGKCATQLALSLARTQRPCPSIVPCIREERESHHREKLIIMKRALIIFALLILLAPALLFAQGEVTIEGLNDRMHALSTDLIILAKELRRVDDRVTVLEAAQIVPAGEFCVVSANTGLHGPTGFQLRPETLDRYVNSFGELPEGISMQDSRIFPEGGILEVRYVVLGSMYDIEIVERWHNCEFRGVELNDMAAP